MKFINLVSLITILLFNLIVFICVYWSIYPYNPITFNTPMHRVENRVIKSGGYLIYYVDYCKYTNVVPTISRYFVDGITYLVSDKELAIPKPKGCRVSKMQVYVPKALPKGEMKFQIVYHYQMNPLRTIDVSTFTESFIIE